MFKRGPLKISLLVLLCFLMVMTVGCSGSSNSGSTDDSYTFSLTIHDPETSTIGVLYQAWADKINELTDGHVTVNIYGSGSLVEGTEAVDGVTSGQADIAWVYTSFFTGQFPLTEVVAVPLLGLKSPDQTTKVLWDLYEEYDELQEELSAFKVLMIYGNPLNILCTKDEVTSLADLKGMKLRSPTGGIAEVLQAWDTTPQQMNSSEIYDALQKGTIDGFIHEYNGVNTFSLYEQVSYYLDLPLYDGVFVLAMNWDSWNSLPEEYQEAIESVSLRENSVQMAIDFNAAAMEAKESIMSEHGGTLVTPSDEFVAELQVAADAYMDEWAANNTTDDFDAEDYLIRTLELIEEYTE